MTASLDAPFTVLGHARGMTRPIRPMPLARLLAVRIRALMANKRAAALVEMALVLPLFLALLMGILVYGQYFMLAHSVQQAANDGARAAITGLDAGDRRAIATRAVDRSLAAVGGFSASARTITVSETIDSLTVAVAFSIPADNLIRSSFVPSPGDVIRADATFELSEED